MFTWERGARILADTVMPKPFATTRESLAWVYSSQERKRGYGLSRALLIWTNDTLRIPLGMRVRRTAGCLGGDLKVLVVRDGATYVATTRLTLPAMEVHRLSRVRAQTEAAMRVRINSACVAVKRVPSGRKGIAALVVWSPCVSWSGHDMIEASRSTSIIHHNTAEPCALPRFKLVAPHLREIRDISWGERSPW